MAVLKGENLGICNPFPGTNSACLYEKQPDSSIKPIIWLTRPVKTTKEEFDALISSLSFRVVNRKQSESSGQEQLGFDEKSNEELEQPEEIPED